MNNFQNLLSNNPDQYIGYGNPALIEEGKNPFSLDSKEPDWSKFHDLTIVFVRRDSA